jgi:AAA ATPase domain
MRGEGEAVTFVCVQAQDDARVQVAGTLVDSGGVAVTTPDGEHLATFPSLAAAMAAATALMRSAPVRVGVDADESSARRLAEACDLGCALVGAAAAALAGDHLPPGARLQPAGENFELEHDPRDARQERERLLFDRGRELDTLDDQVARARAGDGALVVVEGSAGIGKTRLLAEARALAGKEMRVLGARAGEFEGGFAFGVVRQLLEPLLATASPELRTELLAGAASLAEPLFSVAGIAEAEETDEAASFAMLHGLYWLAANAAFQRPTALVIDDLHWIDTPSLRWLGYLARRLDGLPLLVVAAMRPAEEGHEPDL